MRSLRQLATAGLVALTLGCSQPTPERLPGEIGAFTDTPKPNALVTLPLDDPNRQFSLHRPYLHDLLVELRTAYDVRVVRTGTDRAVYDALDATPKIALWVIGGHGDGSAVRLGPFPRVPGGVDAAYLDTGDVDLAQHAATLRPDATVLLLSCSAGAGGRTADNIANHIHRHTDAWRVLASRTSFIGAELTVTSRFPFTARFLVGESFTYAGMRTGIVRFVDATYIATLPAAFTIAPRP